MARTVKDLRRRFRAYAPFILGAAGVIVFFVFISHSVVVVKLQELRLQIQRERLLNMELSSRALRLRSQRLASGRRDFRAEIRQSALESSLLNEGLSGESAVAFGLFEYAGLAAINAVRLLSLEAPLALAREYETTLLLRYAFYLERNRRYDAAIERYRALRAALGGRRDELWLFAELHLGYCLARTGAEEEARLYFQRVLAEAPGTHYAEAARALLFYLDEGRRRSAMIADAGLAPEERVRALLEAGQCGPALEAFAEWEAGGARPLPSDRYRRALCLEESGAMDAALDEYAQLVRQGADRDTATLANRRLLIAGTFYEAGESLQQEARARARFLNDGAVLKEIERAAAQREAPVVVEELEALAAGRASSERDAPRKSEAPDWLLEIEDELPGAARERLAPSLEELARRRAAGDAQMNDGNRTKGEGPGTNDGPGITAGSNPQSETKNQSVNTPPRAETMLRSPAADAAELQLPERAGVMARGRTLLIGADGRRWSADRVRPATDRMILQGGEAESLEWEALASIQPAPLADGSPGVLELTLSGGAHVYARRLDVLAPGRLRATGLAGDARELAADKIAQIETP